MKKLILLSLMVLGLQAGDLAKDKSMGFEINPVSLLSEGTILSGGFSYFNHDNGTEIAVPFLYYSNEDDDYAKSGYESDEFMQLNIDLHYRKYHDGTIGGLYYGGFGRYTYLDGKLKDEHMNARVSKVGLAAEIGYRAFGLLGYEQLYWGASFSMGAYMSNKYDMFNEPMLGDAIALVDVEFFKFGVSF